MRTRLISMVAVVWLLTAADARADDFWSFWADGKAELDGYALTQPRYGKLRAGTAVLVFVTEDFSDSARVKADPGKHPKSDVYPVMKLNFVREFQTGIYDYHVLTSTFVKTESAPLGSSLAKTSFTAQEWCGHVFAEWLPHGDRLDGVVHSYFDGEEWAGTLPFVAGGILEEQVPLLIRGLRGDWLRAGEKKTVPFLPSQLEARFSHVKAQWGEATVERAASGAPVKTVLGTVGAVRWTLAVRGGETTTFTVEAAAPHRILAWSSTSGEAATITGSARLPYWELNQPGGEASLKVLGLKPLQAASAGTPR
jgi:hypothetical protein